MTETPYEDQRLELRCEACGKVQKHKRQYLALKVHVIAGADHLPYAHKCSLCKRTTTFHIEADEAFSALVDKVQGRSG